MKELPNRPCWHRRWNIRICVGTFIWHIWHVYLWLLHTCWISSEASANKTHITSFTKSALIVLKLILMCIKRLFVFIPLSSGWTHRDIRTFRERAPHSWEMLPRSLLVLMAFLALASSSRMLPVHEVECFQKQEYCIDKCASLKGLKLCRYVFLVFKKTHYDKDTHTYTDNDK